MTKIVPINEDGKTKDELSILKNSKIFKKIKNKIKGEK
jgi:hypothetical protein